MNKQRQLVSQQSGKNSDIGDVYSNQSPTGKRKRVTRNGLSVGKLSASDDARYPPQIKNMKTMTKGDKYREMADRNMQRQKQLRDKAK
jgi:hypothetical protein